MVMRGFYKECCLLLEVTKRASQRFASGEKPRRKTVQFYLKWSSLILKEIGKGFLSMWKLPLSYQMKVHLNTVDQPWVPKIAGRPPASFAKKSRGIACWFFATFLRRTSLWWKEKQQKLTQNWEFWRHWLMVFSSKWAFSWLISNQVSLSRVNFSRHEHTADGNDN